MLSPPFPLLPLYLKATCRRGLNFILLLILFFLSIHGFCWFLFCFPLPSPPLLFPFLLPSSFSPPSLCPCLFLAFSSLSSSSPFLPHPLLFNPAFCFCLFLVFLLPFLFIQDIDDEVLIVGNGEVRMRTQGGAEYARMFSHPTLPSNAAAAFPLPSALKDRSRLPSLASQESQKQDGSDDGGGGAGGGGGLGGRSGAGRGRKSLSSSEGVMAHLQSERRSKQVRIRPY